MQLRDPKQKLEQASEELKSQVLRNEQLKNIVNEDVKQQFQTLREVVKKELDRLSAYNDFANKTIKVLNSYNTRIKELETDRETVRKIKTVVYIISGVSALIALLNGFFVLSQWVNKFM